MLMPDVNVLVSAYRLDSPHHRLSAGWLDQAVNGVTAVGVSDAVLTGFVRVVTHPRVFVEPTTLIDALDRLNQLLADGRVQRVLPGRSYWSIFCRLCVQADVRGNLVADAAHAASAIDAGATWITFDRDFARFPGLSWKVPA